MPGKTKPDAPFFDKLQSDCTVNELKALYHTTRTFAPAGTVCDIGCGVGGSTAAICKGLSDAGIGASGQVYAYDLFENHASPHASLVDFQAMTRRFSDFVRVIPGDLRKPSVIPDSIDLLFIDAAKSLALHEAINSSFLPRLRFPGLLINQDFGRPHLYWIHLMFSDLLKCARDFEIIDDMIIVKLSEAVDWEKLPGVRPSSIGFRSAESSIASLRERLEHVPARDGVPYGRILSLSLCSLAAAHGRRQLATRYFNAFESSDGHPPKHLRRAIDQLRRAIDRE